MRSPRVPAFSPIGPSSSRLPASIPCSRTSIALMPAKNGSLGFVVKLVLVLAVLAGAGLLVFRSFAPTVIVDTVRRELAVDTVTGSVTVNADGGIRPLRSEAAGKVVQCDLLAADATFK